MAGILAMAAPAGAQVAQGGTFTLDQTVIPASGGRGAAGGQFTLDWTIGQPAAGGNAAGGPFVIYSGFLSLVPESPTAAGVAISGRVTPPDGIGLPNVVFTLSDARGVSRTARTSPFGYYGFEDVRPGESYVISAAGKGRSFLDPVRMIAVSDSLTGVDFVSGN